MAMVKSTQKPLTAPPLIRKTLLKYLFNTVVSVLVAPAVTLGISSFAQLIKGKLLNESLDLWTIFYDCLYGDVLFSILSVCIILLFSLRGFGQDSTTRYIGGGIKYLKFLWRLCLLFSIGLVFLGIYYKTVLNGTVVKSNWIYNFFEVFGFIDCVFLQALSNPKEYMTT